MSSRPLSSFPLPPEFQQRLLQCGFSSQADVQELSPSQLAKGLLPICATPPFVFDRDSCSARNLVRAKSNITVIFCRAQYTAGRCVPHPSDRKSSRRYPTAYFGSRKDGYGPEEVNHQETFLEFADNHLVILTPQKKKRKKEEERVEASE